MVIYLLILLAILTRFIPHPANFTAVGEMALFSGFYLQKKWSFILVIVVMLISDFFIGFYNPWIMLSVYGSFATVAILGWFFRNKAKGINVLGLSLFSSTLFYLITNFVVWLAGNMYPKNISGLLWCYYMAIPFYRNMILGDLFYVIILFGAYALTMKMIMKGARHGRRFKPSRV